MEDAPDTAPVEVVTSPGPEASVIWLHGLGADGYDFEGIVPQLRLPAGLRIRFIFPHAPYRPVTINNGYVMRAWYDVALSGGRWVQNMDHIRESVEAVKRLIRRENERGIPSHRIVLGGFSQGAAVAMHTGLCYPQRLAGILSLSAPLPEARTLVSGISRENAHTPVFIAHGEHDSLIPYASALQSLELLTEHGVNVEWHSYPMEHGVHPEEIIDISLWLQKVLGHDQSVTAG